MAVNLNHYNLADFIIKKALLQWPPASLNPPEIHYPRPPDYSWDGDLQTQFFKLGKIPSGTSNNKIILVFGHQIIEEQNSLISTSSSCYRGRAGEFPFEVVFDLDAFYQHHPGITSPIISKSLIPAGTPCKRKRKKTLTASEIALDDDDSLLDGLENISSLKQTK